MFLSVSDGVRKRSWRGISAMAAMAGVLFACVFADNAILSPYGSLGSVLRRITETLFDEYWRRIFLAWLFVYCVAFTIIKGRLTAGRPSLRTGVREYCLIALLLLASFCPAVIVAGTGDPARLFLLLGGAMLGLGFSAWAARQQRLGSESETIARTGIIIFAILLAAASCSQPKLTSSFSFAKETRWSGLWGNPNIAGLLMAAGVLLALGLLPLSFEYKGKHGKIAIAGAGTGSGNRILDIQSPAVAALWLLAAALMGHGLLHSYSRGAWIATIIGIGYLLSRGLRRNGARRGPGAKYRSGGEKPEWPVLFIILTSGLTLFFWQFRQTDWPPAHRAFSALNSADFSWRNRIAAWEGALQIMAEYPFFGTGWNRTEPLYDHYYLAPKLAESGAIEMNDYLLIGATIGIPALFFLGMYVWLTLNRREEGGNEAAAKAAWQRTVCHAGAIVLLVGFWFDGGLFQLPTAATFWILLELGGSPAISHPGLPASDQPGEVLA